MFSTCFSYFLLARPSWSGVWGLWKFNFFNFSWLFCTEHVFYAMFLMSRPPSPLDRIQHLSLFFPSPSRWLVFLLFLRPFSCSFSARNPPARPRNRVSGTFSFGVFNRSKISRGPFGSNFGHLYIILWANVGAVCVYILCSILLFIICFCYYPT